MAWLSSDLHGHCFHTVCQCWAAVTPPWLHYYPGADVTHWENELSFCLVRWWSAVHESVSAAFLHCEKEPGLLLRMLRLVWLLHLCWSMLYSLLKASCLIYTGYFGDCVLLKISHSFQLLDGSSICRKLMQACVKLPLPINGDLQRNRHSNIFQWAETWENQLGPFYLTVVGHHEQAHPCTVVSETM